MLAEADRDLGLRARSPEHGTVSAALQARYMNILVTDEGSTSFLLDDTHE